MHAGMNPPSPQGGDDSSGRIPGSGSPDQAQAGPQDQKQGTADAKLKNDIGQLRQMEAALLELAQSYPIATKTLRSASESLRSAQRQIVSSPGLQEPPVPNTFA